MGILRSVRSPHWEREKEMKSNMETEKFITLKYRDLAIQLATITIFARVCPLAPLVILITNAIDLRVCARHLLLYSRRTVLRRNMGIGAWFNVVFFIFILSTLLQILVFTVTSESVVEFSDRTKPEPTVVDHLNFVPMMKFRIYAFTPCCGGKNGSVDEDYSLDYLNLKVFPEYDYQAVELEKGDTPFQQYVQNIENFYGVYKPSCSCTTAHYHRTWESTNDYDLNARRYCYFRGYWRRYTSVISKGRYVGLSTGSQQYYTRLARMGRNVANFTGRVFGFFGFGILAPLITVPVNAIFNWEDFFYNYYRRYMDIFIFNGWARHWRAYYLWYLKWLVTVLGLIVCFIVFSIIYWVFPNSTMEMSESEAIEHHVKHYSSGQPATIKNQ